jgi:hypothetical protein
VRARGFGPRCLSRLALFDHRVRVDARDAFGLAVATETDIARREGRRRQAACHGLAP